MDKPKPPGMLNSHRFAGFKEDENYLICYNNGQWQDGLPSETLKIELVPTGGMLSATVGYIRSNLGASAERHVMRLTPPSQPT